MVSYATARAHTHARLYRSAAAHHWQHQHVVGRHPCHHRRCLRVGRSRGRQPTSDSTIRNHDFRESEFRPLLSTIHTFIVRYRVSIAYRPLEMEFIFAVPA